VLKMEGYRGFHPYPRHWVPPASPQRQTPRHSRDPYSPSQLSSQSVPVPSRDSSEEHVHYAPQGYTDQPPLLEITVFGIGEGHMIGNALHVGHHPHEAYGGRTDTPAGGRMAVYHHGPPQPAPILYQHPHAHGGGVKR